jgi:chromosome segregation ATPase
MSDTTTSSDPSVVGTTTDKHVVSDDNSSSVESKDPKFFDADYVKELRNEAAKYRTERNEVQKSVEEFQSKLQEYESKIKEFEKEKMTAEERQKLEFSEAVNKAKSLEDEIRSTRLEAAVAKNVVKFELADADATLKLMDQSKVQYDDAGRPSNIEEILTATLEQYPFLKGSSKKQAVDTGATNPGRQKNNSLTREAIAAMSHEERASRMDEITKWMRNGYK